MVEKGKNDLADRLFRFAVAVIKATRKLPNAAEYRVIIHQLVKSATSTGANYEESQAAVSNADFSNKIGIALKEMRETHYWIRIVVATLPEHQPWLPLEKEADELKRILGSIYSKTSRKR
ncbi:MAG: four helix bundle protein [Phaeodactylibacter sp.]|uniref:four helix bundle protein n=1 Tax=Phaeodactylibacter sp. TaxID=1940289 RepID=UPI0032EDEB3A